MIFSPLRHYEKVNSIQVKFHKFSSFFLYSANMNKFVFHITPVVKVYTIETMVSSVMEAMCSFITQKYAQVIPNFCWLTMIN